MSHPTNPHPYNPDAQGITEIVIKQSAEANDSVQRLVLRSVCEECGHLASEHIEGSICGSFYIEEVMLPVCECGATCEEEGDELCLNCWEDRPGYGLQANAKGDRS